MPVHMSGCRRIAVLVLTLLSVAACTGSGGSGADMAAAPPDAADGVVSQVTELESVSADDEEEQGQGGVGRGETQPGTELRVGEPATVAIESNGKRGRIDVTITDITQGDAADLAGVETGQQTDDLQPYYVTIEIENVGDSEMPYAPLDSDFHGRLDTGEPARELGTLADFRPCQSEPAPVDFAEGKTFETCRAFLVEQGRSIESVVYEGFESPYADDPIIWDS